jgi:putative transposase
MASAIGQAMQLARTRLASAASPILRLMIQRDHEVSESELLRRELEILRTGRENMLPQKRPDYRPAQRLAILQLMRLRGWNMRTTAKRFVIHENTVRAWIKAVEGNGSPNLLAGAIVWNRMDDAVRWAAHELRRLCPEPEFGTRTMARHLLRAGIAISRSSVQRMLREPEQKKPARKARPAMEEPVGVQPHDLLKPKKPNQVWHMDLTQFRVLWFTFFIAATLDGFSRKILALKVYAKTPCARNLAALVKSAAVRHGKPEFIITDNGGQFRKQFGRAVRRQRIRHVRTRVRNPFLNGKIERFFRSLKLWQRPTLMVATAGGIQRRLDSFAAWYNTCRPHSALGFRTPEEAYGGKTLPNPIAYRTRDEPTVKIQVARRRFRDDPHLPVPEISVRRAA